MNKKWSCTCILVGLVILDFHCTKCNDIYSKKEVLYLRGLLCVGSVIISDWHYGLARFR